MIKKYIGVLTLLVTVSSLTFAQNTGPERLPITVSTYQINGLTPGLKIGIDYPLTEVVKQRVKRNSKTKSISKLWYLNGSMSIATEPFSNTNWLTSLEIGRMRTRNDKWFASPTLGLGALVKFNKGNSWEVIDGVATELGTTSRTYFAPSLGMAFGRHLKINEFDLGLFGRGNGVMAVGMNNTTLPLLSLEIGMRCSPSFSFSKPMHTIKKVTK